MFYLFGWGSCKSNQVSSYEHTFDTIHSKGKDLMALQYTDELPANSMHIENPERGSPAEIDSYFLPHLTWAMTWLFVGFLQIYQAAASGWSAS